MIFSPEVSSLALAIVTLHPRGRHLQLHPSRRALQNLKQGAGSKAAPEQNSGERLVCISRGRPTRQLVSKVEEFPGAYASTESELR